MQDWLKNLISKIIFLLIGIAVGIAIGYIIHTPEKVEIPVPEIIYQDRHLRDSIYVVKDSIQEKIIYIEKNYNEEVSTILSNSDSTNLQFFTDYVENYNY